MTEFLLSIKSDLLSRRLLPFVIVLGVAFVAALGYAMTGGASKSTPVVSASLPNAPAGHATGSAPVSVAGEDPHEAVSETPGGVRYQSQGPTRDPFIPLASPPEAKSSGSTGSKAASGGGSSSTGASSGGSSGGGSGSGGTGTATPTPKKPSKPSKPPFPYAVSVQLGPASTTPGQPATLTSYENLSPSQPLPSKQDVRVSFERVTSTGNAAVFKLVVAPILHGVGICLPSTSECQAIALEVGKSEELEYVEANGQTVVYELKVVGIAEKSGSASAARVKRAAHAARAKHVAHAARAKRN